jgi:hypothetical protein|tara:strand:+ start:1631 stop:2119 length:489 start_codon:yes stop_codon:yes gene_type:complete
MSDEFFDGPIPGASFTEPVGTSAIQGPPKYTKPEDALAYVMTVALTQKSYNLMRAALELGLPLEPMVDTLLFGGLSEGAFTVDTLMLIKPAFLDALDSMYKEDGLVFLTSMPQKDDEEYDAIMQQAADKRRILEGDEEPVEVEETEEKVSSVDIPKTGLMGN